MQIQFDGEITNIPSLTTNLEVKGIEVSNIKTSRWLGRDANLTPIDRGGRIDVELPDDHVLPEKKAVVTALEQEIDASPYIVKTATPPGK